MYIKAALLLATAFVLTSCGPSSRPRDAGTSDFGSTGDTATVGSTSGGLAQCNRFTATGASGKVTAYYSGATLYEDRVRVRLTGLPSGFDSTAGMHVKFYRWKASLGGAAEIDSSALSFTVVSSSGASISGIMTSIGPDDIRTLRQQFALGGTTAQDFFNGSTIVVAGTDFDWQALKVVFYKDSSVVAQADVLLPVFTANPAKYGASHASVLNALHPFWAERSSMATDAQWAARAQAYCF